MKEKECGGIPIVYRCPVCGLPIREGPCPGGCPVEIKTVKLDEIGPAIANIDIPAEADVCIIDKDSQWATLEIVKSWAEPQRARWSITISSVFRNEALEYIHDAIYTILTLYLYRRVCEEIDRIVKKWKKKRVENKKHMIHLQLTENQYRVLKKAVDYYKVNTSLLVDAFTFEEIEEAKDEFLYEGKEEENKIA